MISPVFVKLSLISLGTLGVGVGGYFVYKNTFSKKFAETSQESVNQVNVGETTNERNDSNTTQPVDSGANQGLNSEVTPQTQTVSSPGEPSSGGNGNKVDRSDGN